MGTWRLHASLQQVGVDSRVLVADRCLTGQCNGLIDLVPRTTLSAVSRLTRRLGIPINQADIWSRRLDRAMAANRHQTPEILSHPFGSVAFQSHPWTRKARCIVVHWTSGSLDWSKFFQEVPKSTRIAVYLHDQNPYMGAFHYEWDRARNPVFEELEQQLVKLKSDWLFQRKITVLSNSKWNLTQAMNAKFFRPDTVFKTAYYPLDTSDYSPLSRHACREVLNLPAAAATIGFACEDAGNPRKGMEVLWEALITVREALKAPLNLLTFGKPHYRTDADPAGVNVVHLGHLNSHKIKALAYSAMDIFCAPSQAEAFGQTALESLACGTSVVASDVGGLAEATFHGTFGRLAEPGSSCDLARAILSLLADDETRTRTANEAPAAVAARHDPRTLGLQLAKLIVEPTPNAVD